MTGCSHTSWIDNRELYTALRSNGELKQSSIELLPACGAADAMVEVTHNLDRTVEWTWTLKSRQGESIAIGSVVAYTSRDAGAKIADGVAGEIASARGDDVLVADARRSQPETIPPRTLRVGLMPSDFAVHDTRLDLTLDDERVTARDMQGDIVFSFALAEFRDARLKREWGQPVQLPFPTGLIAPTEYMDPRVQAAMVVSYFGAAVIVAQIRTPWHRLELAWVENGETKSVTLQVSASRSKEFLSELRAAASPRLLVYQCEARTTFRQVSLRRNWIAARLGGRHVRGSRMCRDRAKIFWQLTNNLEVTKVPFNALFYIE